MVGNVPFLDIRPNEPRWRKLHNASAGCDKTFIKEIVTCQVNIRAVARVDNPWDIELAIKHSDENTDPFFLEPNDDGTLENRTK